MGILGVVDCFGESMIRLTMTARGAIRVIRIAMTARSDLQNLAMTTHSHFTQIQRRELRLLC